VQDPNASTPPDDRIPQGIAGKIEKLMGDFSCCPVTGQKVPGTSPIRVIAGEVELPEDRSILFPSDLAELDVLATTQPDVDGMFEFILMAGTYTVLAETGDVITYECFVGSTLCSVVVEEDQFIEVQLTDRSEASF
jgi:hypothetical protein